jgi:asparagine synthase (glutamine-hydrolysing)
MVTTGDRYLWLDLRSTRLTIAGNHSHVSRRGPICEASLAFALEPDPDISGCSSWHWDGTHLTCRTSASGFVPLFYVEQPGQICISTSLATLRRLGQCREVDWSAVALCMVLGHYIEDLTPFSHVRVVPPSAEMAWSADTGSRIRPTSRTLDRTDVDDCEECYDAYDAQVRHAIAAYPRFDIAQGLSGGRDSRHILLALDSLGLRPTRLVTCGHYLNFADADTEIACRLAELLRLSIVKIAPGPDRLHAELRKNEATEFQSLSHSWGLGLADALCGASSLYDGMNGGDLFGRGAIVQLVRREFGDELPEWQTLKPFVMASLFDARLERIRRLIPESVLGTEHFDHARQLLGQSLDKYQHYQNPLQAFLYYNLISRDTSVFTYGMMRNGEVLCPLNAPRVVKFALSLPWRLSSDAEFQAKALRRCYPRFAGIPFVDDYKPRVNASWFDPQAERESAGRFSEALTKMGSCAISPEGMALLSSGRINLKDLQALVYVAQLSAIGSDEDPGMSLIPPSEQHDWKARPCNIGGMQNAAPHFIDSRGAQHVARSYTGLKRLEPRGIQERIAASHDKPEER